MLDSTQLAAQYNSEWDRDGYAIIPGFLNADEVAEVQAHIDALLNTDPPAVPAENRFLEDKDRPDTVKYLAHLTDYDPFFDDLQKSDRCMQLAEALHTTGN